MTSKQEIAARRLVAVGYRRACRDWLWWIGAAVAALESDKVDPLARRPIALQILRDGPIKLLGDFELEEAAAHGEDAPDPIKRPRWLTARPFGCKCTNLVKHVIGDGCDECNSERAADLEES